MSEYNFNCVKRHHSQEIERVLNTIYKTNNPVIICVGTDLVVGDSFGPLVGTLIKNRLNGKAYVYGTLDNPITAKEIPMVDKTIKNLHPHSKILVVDAAIGNTLDVGVIKVKSGGIKPGLGYNKELPIIGDVSIIGIVSDNKSSLLVRLGLVYSLALDVSEGIIKALI